MPSSNYKTILPPIEIYTEIIPNSPKHQEFSTRGIIFNSDSPIEIGSTLKVSLKQVSLTGSEDFSIKVLQCIPVGENNVYEIHANFYGITHDREVEILDFINSGLH